jgi:predicted XRE-type DNA-binding protein
MKTGGDFHKDLEKDFKNPKFKVPFEKEKGRLRLSDKLRNALQRSNLSIRRVANQMGTSKSQVERMINDPEANIGVDSLIKFAAVVGRKVEINLR